MLDEMYYILSSTVSYCYDLKKKLLISNIMNGKRYYWFTDVLTTINYTLDKLHS